MKNGQILEGAPYYFALGYPEDNYNDTVRLDGPKGSDAYMDGHSIICAHDIVKLEIIDRE